MVWGLLATMAIFGADELVQQRGFARVGTAENGDKTGFHFRPAAPLATGWERRTRTCSTRISSLARISTWMPSRSTDFARLRDAAQPFGDQPADGGGFEIFLGVEFEQIGHARHVEIAGDDVAALAVFLHVGIGLVLVANLAQDHFHQVLHGGQAGGVAVLVHHDDHVGAVLLHLAHEVVDRLGLGHEADGPHQFADGAVGALVFIQFEHVPHMHEADDLIDGSFVHRNAGILLVDDQLPQLLQRGVRRDGHDIGPRRHDLAHHLVAELHHRLNEFAVFFLDQAFLGAGGDQRFDVFGGGGGFFRAVWFRRSISTQRMEEVQQADERPGHQAHDAEQRGSRGASHCASVRR